MRNIKRLIAAVMTVALLASMTIIEPVTAEEKSDADVVTTLGMLKGTGSGVTEEYLARRPERYQAAILFLRLLGIEEEALAWEDTENFIDIPSNTVLDKSNKAILAYLKSHSELGFEGYTDGTFKPFELINAQMYYKVLLTALGYRQNINFTWNGVFDFAASVGLSSVAAVEDFKIEHIAAATVEALKAKKRDSDKTLLNDLIEKGVISESDAVDAGLYDEDPDLTEYYFGYKDFDGTRNNGRNPNVTAFKYTSGQEFYADTLSLVLDNSSVSGKNIRMAIYADNDGMPGDLQGQTGSQVAVHGLNSFSLDKEVEISADTDYWIAAMNEWGGSGSGDVWIFKQDTTLGGERWRLGNYQYEETGDFPDGSVFSGADIAENSTYAFYASGSATGSGSVEKTPVASISISSEGSAASVMVGERIQMYSNVLPVDATDKSVLWSVTPGTGAATIDNNGLLRGAKEGTVTVTATAEDGSNVTDSMQLTVLHNPNPIEYEKLQYNGEWEGSLKTSTYNMSVPVGRSWDYSGPIYNGFVWIAKESGTLGKAEIQIASNFEGETSKSAKPLGQGGLGSGGAVAGHEFPATWDLSFYLYEIGSDNMFSGSALKHIPFSHTNQSGEKRRDSRLIYSFDLSDVEVTEGKKYFFAIYNEEDDPYNDFVSLNTYANEWAPQEGSGNRTDIFHGDYDYVCASYNPDKGLSLHPTMLVGLGIKMEDGQEYGGVEFDSTAPALAADIGGSNKVKMSWTKDYNRVVDKIAIVVGRKETNPGDDLIATISGSDIETVTVTIPKESVNYSNINWRGYSDGDVTNMVIDLPHSIKLSPDIEYTVELSSPGSSNKAYTIKGVRDANQALDRASVRNTALPQPAEGVPFITPNMSSGLGKKSSDGGSTWQHVGWNIFNDSVDLPIALRVAPGSIEH